MADHKARHHRNTPLAEFDARVRDTDVLIAEAAGEVEPYQGKHRYQGKHAR